MRRLLLALFAVLTAVVVTAAPVAADGFPQRIDLPTGWQPEGITAGRGPTAYVGSLANGAIARLNVRTGAVDPTFVPGVTGGVAAGMDYERRHDRLWVAGGPGPTGQVRVYDGTTGALLQTYTFTAGFLNDVAVTRNAVYVTDSAIQQLIVIPLGAGGEAPQPSAAFTRPIQAPFTYVQGFNANGIVALGKWLLIPQSATGKLFAVDADTGASRELLPAGSIPSPDGLELRGRTLYVVIRPTDRPHAVARFQVRGGALVEVGRITSSDLNVPTTVAVVAGRLWVVNARFGVQNPGAAAYWVTRLPSR